MYKTIFKIACVLACVASLIIIILLSILTQKVLATDIQEAAQVETQIETTESITYKYNLTPDEREMLARLVYLESNMESLDCQKGIVSVVINRLNSGYWGNTLHSVVYAKNQFTPAKRIPYVTPTSTNYEAVDHVIQYGVTLPEYVLYFRANYHHRWWGYCGYVQIDRTYFGYMAKDKKD